MSAASPKFNPKTSEISSSATSSPALECGVTPLDSPDGPMTDLLGQAVVLAPVSQPLEKAKGLETLVTSGHIGYASSGSAALQQSLESRLRQRLDTAGSTLFTLTWKRRRTPLGRSYLERAASVRRTSDKGCTSVPTTTVHDGERGGQAKRATGETRHGSNLQDFAMMAIVPTPMSGSPATETYNAAGNNDYSRKIVELASVCSPTSQDCSRGGKPARPWDTGVPLTQQVALSTVATPTCPAPHDSENSAGRPRIRDGYGMDLAAMAGLATPAARDYRTANLETYSKRGGGKKGEQLQNQVKHLVPSATGVDPDGSIRTRLDQLPRQAQLAASGATATGGTRGTKSTGQLNPDYSRWLMGLPIEFSNCADTAMRSVRLLRQSSSKRSRERTR